MIWEEGIASLLLQITGERDTETWDNLIKAMWLTGIRVQIPAYTVRMQSPHYLSLSPAISFSALEAPSSAWGQSISELLGSP